MKLCKKKVLSCLLVFVMCLSVMPATVFAADESTTVSNANDLVAAIEAIPEGGSGEITIKDVNMSLSKELCIENKDITFNLVNSSLLASIDGYGDYPVILGVNANITINADANSSIQSRGKTGVVQIKNGTDYDETTSSFEENFSLKINGGRYICDKEDNLFVVTSGTEAVLTDIYCNGKVDTAGFEESAGIVPGKITVNSGKFSNDVEKYVADGKFFCKHGENYYVRDKEFSDDFSKPLTNGKLVFNYVKPSADDEAVWLICEDFYKANPDFYFAPESFSEDFSKLELCIFQGTAKEEFHIVDVVWDYDATILKAAQSFIEKFPKDRPWFNVSDLELVNYWVYHNSDSEVDSLANYSGELKSILGNNNFLFNVEGRSGLDDTFYTESVGSAKLIHGDKVYFASGQLGARAEHAIYVPESTKDTKEALMAAAQKRIDDYIGENIIKITAADETVTDYYNSEIARCDAELATARSELANTQATLDAEKAKDELNWDWNLISQCEIAIMDCEWNIQDTSQYKENFIKQFNEGGDLHFLKNATGDFFFNVEVTGKEESYKFVIIKDDTKLAVPSYATVDLNTNVSVTTDSSTVPLDTIIEVEKLTDGADYNRIIGILDVDENETFDIKLHSGSLNKYVTELKDGKFEVKIPIPEKFEGKNLVVYYVDQNNNPVKYEVTVKDNFAVFTTDHFSIYTLAEMADNTQELTQNNGEKIEDGKDVPAKETSLTGNTDNAQKNVSPETKDTTPITLYVLLIMASGIGISGIAYKKRKRV